MADLRGDDGSLGLPERDRAQVMLITAFLLAASFVALALVLNSVIYTENIATRSEEARGADAVFYRSDIMIGTEQLIEYENRNDTAGFATIEDNYRRAFRSMNNRTATQHSVDGVNAQASIISTTEGTRIAQFNASRNFTSADGLEDWELVDNVESTRAFWINVTDSDALEKQSNLELLLGLSGDPGFNVTVWDGSQEWAMVIYEDETTTPDETVVNVVGYGECRTGPDPMINITAGTINGEPCQYLNYGEGIGTPHDIDFDASHKIQGNFSVVVDSTTPTAGRYDADTDSPFAVDAIYSSTIHVTYESTNLHYETDLTAAPGESDD